jgi:hypothetical protein
MSKIIAVIAILWGLFTFVVPSFVNNPKDVTVTNIEKLEECLNLFETEYIDIPEDPSELKAFCSIKYMWISFKDGYHSDFEYINLDGKDWILRSFSEEKKENTLVSEKNFVKTSLQSSSFAIEQPDFTKILNYPFVMVEGAFSNDKKFSAHLFVNKEKKTLVVRNSFDNNFFMIADHDHVDEFMWLPDNEHIVFSATKSLRYADGIYLWNLKTNNFENILYISQKFSHLVHKKKWYLSLIGYNPKNYSLWFYVKENNKQILDAQELFSNESINFIVLTGKQKGVYSSDLNLDEVSPPNYSTSFFDRKNCPSNNKIQKQWCSLPLQGSANKALIVWEKFIDKYPNKSLSLYAMWFLLSLYMDIMAELPDSSQLKVKMKSSALKYIIKAKSYTTLPSWMFSSILHMEDLLHKGQSLGYKTTNLDIDFIEN